MGWLGFWVDGLPLVVVDVLKSRFSKLSACSLVLFNNIVSLSIVVELEEFAVRPSPNGQYPCLPHFCYFDWANYLELLTLPGIGSY